MPIFEFFLGQTRGRPLDSHDDLVKHLSNICSERGLFLDPRFLQDACKLKLEVSDVRDREIAHEKSPRTITGVGFGSSGGLVLSKSPLYPTEKEIAEITDGKQRTTKALDELLHDIGGYLDQVARFVEVNHETVRPSPKPELLYDAKAGLVRRLWDYGHDRLVVSGRGCGGRRPYSGSWVDYSNDEPF